jgi:DNA-binding SARP family transcriptional activator/ABC-type glycerol-3-phosphate transport system substrate-binding protein
VRLGVLGQLEVHDGGEPLRLGGRRQQLVLAVLLDRANERVSVDRLIDAVWGEAPPPTARKTLQAYVSRLRRIVGDSWIETIADGYRLDASPDDLDALQFEALAVEGERLLGEAPYRAGVQLRDALGLWRGSPYGSLGDEQALRPSTARLLERRLEVLEHRIGADLVVGDGTGVVAELQALVSDHPLREYLHRLQMLALYRSGRQADALEVANRLRRRLGDELGLEPSPAVQELQRRILDQDPTLLVRPDHRATDGPSSTADAAATALDGTGERATSQRADGAGAGAGRAVPNPYQGLRPFTERDSSMFFGRTTLVTELLDRVATEPLTVVVGPSGSGKSSVVRAGLLPVVRATHPSWMVATMVPGAHPFAEFEAALLNAMPDPRSSLEGQLRGDDLDILRAVLRVVPDGGRLLLVVDQLEELFLLTAPDTRDRFARALVEAIDDPHSRLTVVATLRADFLNRPLQHATLGPSVEEHSVLVPPLSPAELEAATVRPAQAVGVDVAPELVAQLVAEVAFEPAALPLFQYTLTELFDAREGGPLTLTGYRRLGGIQGALSSRADRIAGQLDETGRAVARQLFLRLVTLGEGIEDTRRRAPRSELDNLPLPADAVGDVLRRFGDARLLAFDRDAVTGEPTVEVAHEALLREWPLLHDWIDDARADLRLGRSLALTAEEWEANGHDDGYLLTGSRLATYDEWRVRGVVEVTGTEALLIEASRDHDTAQRSAEEARRNHEIELERRAGRRLRQLVAVLAVAAVVASGLGIVAANRATELAVARDEAIVLQQLTLARELAANAQIVAPGDQQLGLLLALHAVRITSELGRPPGAELVSVLHWTLQQARIPYPDGAPALVVDSPTGRRGIFALPVDELATLLLAHVDRDLTTEECERYLSTPVCPDPLAGSLGDGLDGEQAISLTSADEPLAGTRVRVFAPILQDGTPAAIATIAAVRAATGGVELIFDQEDNAELILESRIQDIDLLIMPQPSFVPDQTGDGGIGLQDVSTWTTVADTAPHLLALGSVAADGSWPAGDGAVYGLPMEVILKGIVWYSRSAFETAGYEAPTSYPQLEQLVERMVADGHTPWCLGLESSEFDGWPATDIIESLVLHDLGPARYDAWARHDLPFAHPDIRRAFGRYADLFLAEGRVAGGGARAVETEWGDAALGTIEDGLGCMMSHGDSFLSGFLPDDAAWFAFPAITEAGEGTLLGSGTYLVALTDRPEVRAALDAMFSPVAVTAQIEAGEWRMSANERVAIDDITLDDRSRALARQLRRALEEDLFRFDASDLMPKPVWQAFNAGMVTITLEGPDAIDRILAELDTTWDGVIADGR